MPEEHPRHAQVAAATEIIDTTVEPVEFPVNMYEAGDALVIVAPLPAVMPDDVEIDVGPGTVTIRAHVRSAAPKDYLLHEWRYGGMERSVPIPDGFGRDAEASLANGQLALRVLRGEGGAGFTIAPTTPNIKS
jgi:HSP20 family molecular chaperone IbpA